jgi:hypothetical protein
LFLTFLHEMPIFCLRIIIDLNEILLQMNSTIALENRFACMVSTAQSREIFFK